MPPLIAQQQSPEPPEVKTPQEQTEPDWPQPEQKRKQEVSLPPENARSDRPWVGGAQPPCGALAFEKTEREAGAHVRERPAARQQARAHPQAARYQSWAVRAVHPLAWMALPAGRQAPRLAASSQGAARHERG